MRLLPRFRLVLLLLILPTAVVFNSRSNVLVAAEDGMDDVDMDDEDEDEATIEPEGDIDAEDTGGSDMTGEDVEEEEEEELLQPSTDAETTILFIQPENAYELPAGDWVKFMVGFTNNGEKDFIVEYIDASFRYPQDYTFHIQNFSIIEFQRKIEPGRQASFVYSFIPSETFSARPFGLTVNVNYKDADGAFYQDAVFNDTVQIVEQDDGLDGETFFLYVFLAAIAVLLLVAGQQFLSSFSRMKLLAKTPVEMGTANHTDVDYDWIPSESLNEINKSPKKATPKTSPRERRARRRMAGSGSENE